MTRQEIVKELKQYFDIQDLVCPHCFAAFGEKSWQFLDTEILHTVLVLRTEILQVPMICNDYKDDGKITQRGLRCNLCFESRSRTLKGEIYLSAHCNGAGMDFVFTTKSGMTARMSRAMIKEKQDLLPYNVRIEKGVTWLHIDCYDVGVGEKVHEF